MKIDEVFAGLDAGKTLKVSQEHVMELLRRLENSGRKTSYALSVECEGGMCSVKKVAAPPMDPPDEGLSV